MKAHVALSGLNRFRIFLNRSPNDSIERGSALAFMRLAGNKQTSKKHVIWVWYSSKAYQRDKALNAVCKKMPVAVEIIIS